MLRCRILLACLGFGVCCACHPAAEQTSPPVTMSTPTPPTPTPGPPTPAPPTATPPTPGRELTPDGKHFATERIYQGKCAPAGSRGGCHTLTLRPDGTFRNFLYDAAILGSYEIRGNEVTLTGRDASMPAEQLTLSADRTQLGDLVLAP